MDAPARKFSREAPGDRRRALVEAALDVISEAGIERATVRAIAARAGVTAGLIRHHFRSKDDLIAAAFAHHMDRMTDLSLGPPARPDQTAAERLAAAVAANLRPPVVSSRALALWATFLARVPADPGLRSAHEATYHAFRDRLAALIGAALDEAGQPRPAADLARLAVAANAVIDGLWVEGSALPGDFAPDALPREGVAAVAALTGLPLVPPEPAP